MDIKKYLDKIKELTFITLVLLFPLNQQLHLKPFPSIDGFIIDYLIIKISIPEILLILFFILSLRELIEHYRYSEKPPFFIPIFFGISLIATYLSEYMVLSLYESFILLLLFICSPLLFREFGKIWLAHSIKFWIVSLSLLGIFQFYFQESVLNNYYLFGEFPYSEDFYHIKQKGFLFPYLIPPYAIFSHSNIFGGFLLVSIMALKFFKKDDFIFHILVIGMFLIIGSVTVLIAYIFWIATQKIGKINLSAHSIFLIILGIYLLQSLISINYGSYKDNYSVYRRLYMFDITNSYFIAKPLNSLFGVGYYNYFSEVKQDLYRYEIVRFFQPSHNLINFAIWQYGIVGLGLFFYFLIRFLEKQNSITRKFVFIILLVSMFDHYFITNHQLKLYLFLILPYSINYKNSI